MAHWDCAQGQAKMAEITQKHPYLWRSAQKSSNPKRKIVVSILTTRLAESVEGLNSSLAQSPGELQDCKALQEKWHTRDWKGWTTLIWLYNYLVLIFSECQSHILFSNFNKNLHWIMHTAKYAEVEPK